MVRGSFRLWEFDHEVLPGQVRPLMLIDEPLGTNLAVSVVMLIVIFLGNRMESFFFHRATTSRAVLWVLLGRLAVIATCTGTALIVANTELVHTLPRPIHFIAVLTQLLLPIGWLTYYIPIPRR